MAREIYEATASFVANINGRVYSIRKGDTVRAGHELLRGRKNLFQRMAVRFETTSAPRGKRELETE